MSDAARRAITRNLIVQCWGMPDVTIGSVNEPREGEENGVSFNEKWIYRNVGGDPRTPRQRIVYWRRYQKGEPEPTVRPAGVKGFIESDPEVEGILWSGLSGWVSPGVWGA